MSLLKCTIALLALISVEASAAPAFLDRTYTNYAWGFRKERCFIDRAGDVFAQNLTHGGSPKYVWSIDPEVLERAEPLLRDAVQTPLVESMGAVDAGITVWRGRVGDDFVVVREAGDVIGRRECAAADELVRLINMWCPKAAFQPHPFPGED